MSKNPNKNAIHYNTSTLNRINSPALKYPSIENRSSKSADMSQKLTVHSSSKIHHRYTHHDEAPDRAVSMLPAF